MTWDYSKSLAVRLHIGKENVLEEQHIDFQIFQELSLSEKLMIGKLRLNLGEYADPERDGAGREGVIIRRYLMQDSKINSTVKIGIGMQQLEGSRDFIAPPLRAAAVFEGFSGVIASEQEQEGVKTGGKQNGNGMAGFDEVNELQDMYRLALAASWACGSVDNELSADRCVEDIFAGGDGWGKKVHVETRNSTLHPEAQRETARTWVNGDSEDEGMETVTPGNRSFRERLRRRGHTPRGIRYETDNISKHSRPASDRSLRFDGESEKDRLDREDRKARYSTRDEDRNPTVASRTPSRSSRSSANTNNTTSSASAASASNVSSRFSRRTGQDDGTSTYSDRSNAYDPIAPAARTHLPDKNLIIPGDMTSLRSARVPSSAQHSPSNLRFPIPRPQSPIGSGFGSHSFGIVGRLNNRPGSGGRGGSRGSGGSSDRKDNHATLGISASSLGASGDWTKLKGKKHEEIQEWDVREDLRAWKIPTLELEGQGVGKGAAKSKEEKPCEETLKKRLGSGAEECVGVTERDGRELKVENTRRPEERRGDQR